MVTDDTTATTAPATNGKPNGKPTTAVALTASETAQALAPTHVPAPGTSVMVTPRGAQALGQVKDVQRVLGVSDERMQRVGAGLVKQCLAHALVECGFDFPALRRAAGTK
jgi:hypothetical protein